MEFNVLQVVLIFVVTFIAAIDQFNFLESLYQPIVTGLVVGVVLGDVQTGLIVGGTYQLMTIGNMPVGGAQPPNAVIGGIMATVLAISLDLEPAVAVATAIPFALLGQYGITVIFTIMSAFMAKADEAAHHADPKTIAVINWVEMAIIGTVFGIVVDLFFIGGLAFGQEIVGAIPTWLMNGLNAAGLMMRFVGFAILLKVMMNSTLWGFMLMGFGFAILTVNIPGIGSAALLVLALIGFGLAYWDYQNQTSIQEASADSLLGGEEDGI